MNRNLFVVGLVLLLICVGLSGCTDKTESNTIDEQTPVITILTVDEVLDNKLAYDDEYINVEGYFDSSEVTGKSWLLNAGDSRSIELIGSVDGMVDASLFDGFETYDHVLVKGDFQTYSNVLDDKIYADYIELIT